MLSERSSVDIHALKRQGMTISEIARRTNHDRKTIRAYLNGERQPGMRERTIPGLVRRVRRLRHRETDRGPAPVGGDAARRAATARLRGVVSDADAADSCPRAASGVHRVRARHQTRKRGHRAPARGGDPVRLGRDARSARALGFGRKTAYVLVGSLAHSGVWRGVISPSMDTPHLLAAMTTLLALLGGLTKTWRFDRMRTVLDHRTGDLVPQFAAFAKHHGVTAVVCRPRSGNRKGVVEKNNHTATQRWWRTLPDDLTLEQAQASLNTFAAGQDDRRREGELGTTTASALFVNERLRPLPAVVFPVIITEERTATRQALIDWRGNRYSVPPELAAAKVEVRQRLGADIIDIATASGTVVARHQVAEPGLGVTIRDSGHVTALEAIAMASATPGRPHRRKDRIPPGSAALRAAAALTSAAAQPSTVISLAAYEQAAKNRNTLR